MPLRPGPSPRPRIDVLILSCLGFATAQAAGWIPGPPDALGKIVGTLAIFAAATAQTAALAVRRNKADPRMVRWMFFAAIGLSLVIASMVTGPFTKGAAAPVHVIGSDRSSTNVDLVREWAGHGLDAVLVSAEEALHVLRPGDVAIGKLDVPPTLDGVEPGLLSLLWLERRGVRVPNRAAALITVRDKLRTACCLDGAGSPHPHDVSPRGSDHTGAAAAPRRETALRKLGPRRRALPRRGRARTMPRSCQRAGMVSTSRRALAGARAAARAMTSA